MGELEEVLKESFSKIKKDMGSLKKEIEGLKKENLALKGDKEEIKKRLNLLEAKVSLQGYSVNRIISRPKSFYNF